MKCVECQAEIEDKSVYCPKCGARLEETDGQEAMGQDAAETSKADVNQEAPVPDEVDEEPEPEPAEQPTASERLLDAARSGGEKTTETDAGTAWTEGGYSPRALNARFLDCNKPLRT